MEAQQAHPRARQAHPWAATSRSSDLGTRHRNRGPAAGSGHPLARAVGGVIETAARRSSATCRPDPPCRHREGEGKRAPQPDPQPEELEGEGGDLGAATPRDRVARPATPLCPEATPLRPREAEMPAPSST